MAGTNDESPAGRSAFRKNIASKRALPIFHHDRQKNTGGPIFRPAARALPRSFNLLDFLAACRR
jgi:hypothetical protein